jgi:hypothetical protein
MNEVSVAAAEALALERPAAAGPAGGLGGLIEPGLRGLDAVRIVLLRLLSRLLGPSRMRPLVTNRELRVALSGGLGMATALGLTLACPLLLLIISPLILGVPHLIADVRYLVAQPGYHRRLRLALPVGTALLFSAAGFGMQAGLCAVLLTLLLAGGSGVRPWSRRALGIIPVAALVYVGLSQGWYWLELGLAHLHNFLAVLLFYLWRPSGLRRQGRLHLIPVGLFVAFSGVLLFGLLSAGPRALGAFSGYDGLDADGQRDLLAPLLPLAWATRLLLLFAFAQAVHYTIWLRLIPEEARLRAAPRTFRHSLQSLHSDMGGTLLGLALLVGVALALWATMDLAAARTGYFRLALFHGYLELCVLALWWVEGQRGAALQEGAA